MRASLIDFGVPLLLAASVLLLLPVVATLALGRLGYWFLERGKRSATRRVCKWVWLLPRPAGWLVSNILLIRADSEDGNADAAAALLDRCLESAARARWRTRFLCWAAIDIWINAGQYRKALRAIRRFPMFGPERARDAGLYGTMQVNRAEALHNLGRDRLALRLLARTRPFSKRSTLARNGALLLEAWILSQLGEGERARSVLSGLNSRPLSPHYAAEIHFTRAAVELCCGQLDAAVVEANLGLTRAVRSSSERNGRFLLGKIEMARGELTRAVSHYEAGRAHRYQRQGGPSLCELGQVYERLGKLADARQVYLDATLRDPESFAANECRARLARLQLTAHSTPTSLPRT